MKGLLEGCDGRNGGSLGKETNPWIVTEKPGKTGLGCRLACAILPSCAHCLGSRLLGTGDGVSTMPWAPGTPCPPESPTAGSESLLARILIALRDQAGDQGMKKASGRQ